MWQSFKNVYHLLIAVFSNLYFGFPSKKLKVIGVTGTDGKTTTVSLIYHILNEVGYNASMISSLGAVISGKKYDVGFHVTTPSSWQLQRFLKMIAGSKKVTHPRGVPQAQHHLGGGRMDSPEVNSKYLVLEVTSHALDQHRIWGIDFEIGVLTNVTHEHLDYHKTYENYVLAKAKLLKNAKVAVVNGDDESFKIISNRKAQISKIITYGIRNRAEVMPESFSFKTDLLGEFNRYNILAAVAVCRSLGLKDETIKKAITSFKAPAGRGEIVYENDFSVMIDFAHTPNAFEKILSALRPTVKKRIIHVFGSAGERDKTKRPEMGRISAKYADVIILTAEDPRSESLDEINREIESGIFNFQFSIFNENQNFQFEEDKKYYFKISDRQKAINAAVKMAEKGDLVLTTGKAHEKSMNYGHGEEPWDEYEAVKKALGLRLGR